MLWLVSELELPYKFNISQARWEKISKIIIKKDEIRKKYKWKRELFEIFLSESLWNAYCLAYE